MAATAFRIVASNASSGGAKNAARGRLSSSDLLSSIVESSDDAIISKDLDGTILSWNTSAERIFGFSPDEAVGRPITIVIPQELHFEESQILQRIRTGDRIEHYEAIRRRKDGTLI